MGRLTIFQDRIVLLDRVDAVKDEEMRAPFQFQVSRFVFSLNFQMFSNKGKKSKFSPLTTATLCYCDDFCGSFINGDCCPDYASFCLGIEVPDNITVKCKHNGQVFGQFEQIHDNCNLW